MSTKEKYEQTKLAMVPIRDVVIFPFMMVPFERKNDDVADEIGRAHV